MKKIIPFILFLTFTFELISQDSGEEEGSYVPFQMLMVDVIESYGQDRIDAVDRAFEAIDNNSTEPDILSIPVLYFLKSRSLSYQEKFVEAHEEADKIRAVSPQIVSNMLPEASQWAYSLGYVADGFAHWINKERELAMVYFDSANTYFKDGFYANYYLGWLNQNENKDKALEYYTQAENGVSVIKMDWAELYYKKGVIYHGRRLYSNAIQEYSKSINKYPMCKTYLERGKVYYSSSAYQDKTVAYDDFRQVVANCPKYKSLGTAYSYLAGDFYDRKMDDKALEYYKKAYNLGGSYFDAGNASMVYYIKKDWNNTITWANKAINKARGNAGGLKDYYFYRGFAHWSLKNYDATVKDFEKARSLGHRQADQYLREYFKR